MTEQPAGGQSGIGAPAQQVPPAPPQPTDDRRQHEQEQEQEQQPGSSIRSSRSILRTTPAERVAGVALGGVVPLVVGAARLGHDALVYCLRAQLVADGRPPKQLHPQVSRLQALTVPHFYKADRRVDLLLRLFAAEHPPARNGGGSLVVVVVLRR